MNAALNLKPDDVTRIVRMFSREGQGACWPYMGRQRFGWTCTNVPFFLVSLSKHDFSKEPLRSPGLVATIQQEPRRYDMHRCFGRGSDELLWAWTVIETISPNGDVGYRTSFDLRGNREQAIEDLMVAVMKA